MLDTLSYITFLGIGLSTIACMFLRRTGHRKHDSITIVVLGDLGRSPRMMRHATSFADRDWLVNVLAYSGMYLGVS